jgi:C_GCAxxG_C_C family probable redox protein
MSNKRNERIKKAEELYLEGYNCAQAIIGAYKEKLGHSTSILMDTATGFGGGMGKLQNTCGAVTGAFIVMSSLNKQNTPGAEEKLNQDIQTFARHFREEFGALYCKALIEYDLNTEEGIQDAQKNKVFEKKCTNYVRTSVEILENILESSQSNNE